VENVDYIVTWRWAVAVKAGGRLRGQTVIAWYRLYALYEEGDML
jgi:hypothetical protein